MEMSLGDGGADTGWSNFSCRILHRKEKKKERKKKATMKKQFACNRRLCDIRAEGWPEKHPQDRWMPVCLTTSLPILSYKYHRSNRQNGKISFLLCLLCALGLVQVHTCHPHVEVRGRSQVWVLPSPWFTTRSLVLLLSKVNWPGLLGILSPPPTSL